LIVIAVLFAIGVGAFLARYSASKRKRFLDLVFRTSTRGIVLVDHRGIVKMSNAAFLEMVGHDKPVGKNPRFGELLTSPGCEVIYDTYSNFRWLREVYEKRNVTLGSADSSRELEIEMSKVRYGIQQHSLILISLTDFTELSDIKKMQAWAAMAKRVAHEIKSPLSTVLLSAQRLQMDYQTTDKNFKENERYFYLIVEEVKRVREIVNNFQRFANLDETKLVDRNVNEVIDRLLEKYKNRIPNGVTLEKEYATDDVTAKVDERELHEALGNLLDNAFTAMKGQGILTITTMNAGSMPKIGDEQPGPSVLVEISDSGMGIPSDVLPKIFQPSVSVLLCSHALRKYGLHQGKPSEHRRFCHKP
jgi:two-component system nitrogen regulation sensor histidine kinase NtrY